MNGEEQDTQTFLRNLEEQNGGPLEWKTYAFFVGESGDENPRSLGGLIYVVAGKLVFEDFERENSLIRLIGKKKKYEKFKVETPLINIREVRAVAASDARRTVRGKAEAGELPALSGIRKILEKRMEAVIFEDGTAWFFEMYDREGLKNVLAKE